MREPTQFNFLQGWLTTSALPTRQVAYYTSLLQDRAWQLVASCHSISQLMVLSSCVFCPPAAVVQACRQWCRPAGKLPRNGRQSVRCDLPAEWQGRRAARAGIASLAMLIGAVHEDSGSHIERGLRAAPFDMVTRN